MNAKRAASILALSMLPGVSSAGLLDSTLRFWSFDNTLVDSVANIGATSRNWTSGYSTDRDGNSGGALNLGGAFDAIIVAPSSGPASLIEYSLSLWFQMDTHNAPNGRSQLFDTRDSAGAEKASIIGLIDNSAAGNTSGANPEDGWLRSFNTGSNGIPLSGANNQTWHHLLYSVSASQQNIYYNGSTAAISSLAPYGAATPSDFTSGLVFGDKRSDLGGGFNFNGSLDDIALWDRALSAADAAALFAAPASATVPAPVSSLLLLSGLGLLRVGRRKQR